MSPDAPLDAERLQAHMDESPAIVALGVRVEAVDADEGVVDLVMPMAPALERYAGSGQFHGGPLASLIDIAADMAIAVKLGGGVPTIDLRVDYLRPAGAPLVRATGRVRKLGRSIAVSDVEVRDDEGRLCALGRGTYAARVG